MINTQVLLIRTCDHGTERRWNVVSPCQECHGGDIRVDRIWQNGHPSIKGALPMYK